MSAELIGGRIVLRPNRLAAESTGGRIVWQPNRPAAVLGTLSQYVISQWFWAVRRLGGLRCKYLTASICSHHYVKCQIVIC